ncbi:hypothetical protein HPB51_014492 [Rhipicephalus microplus]|uniref:Uncharacterized protein n=1 Tax=Rhipicephalus microplus TaxID=6941 RepID=A0A9J6EH06_RHIMP|nr:hypothetical protein HPB51_014492 [Rhipicephalus microplus]
MGNFTLVDSLALLGNAFSDRETRRRPSLLLRHRCRAVLQRRRQRPTQVSQLRCEPSFSSALQYIKLLPWLRPSTMDLSLCNGGLFRLSEGIPGEVGSQWERRRRRTKVGKCGCYDASPPCLLDDAFLPACEKRAKEALDDACVFVSVCAVSAACRRIYATRARRTRRRWFARRSRRWLLPVTLRRFPAARQEKRGNLGGLPSTPASRHCDSPRTPPPREWRSGGGGTVVSISPLSRASRAQRKK